MPSSADSGSPSSRSPILPPVASAINLCSSKTLSFENCIIWQVPQRLLDTDARSGRPKINLLIVCHVHDGRRIQINEQILRAVVLKNHSLPLLFCKPCHLGKVPVRFGHRNDSVRINRHVIHPISIISKSRLILSLFRDTIFTIGRRIIWFCYLTAERHVEWHLNHFCLDS